MKMEKTALNHIKTLFADTQGVEWGGIHFDPYTLPHDDPDALALYNTLFYIRQNVRYNAANTTEALRLLSTELNGDEFIRMWKEWEIYDMTVTMLPDDMSAYFEGFKMYIVSYFNGLNAPMHFLAKKDD